MLRAVSDRKRAFEAMYAQGDAYGDYNAAYLYALEGAIRDCDWLDIPFEPEQIQYWQFRFRSYGQIKERF